MWPTTGLKCERLCVLRCKSMYTVALSEGISFKNECETSKPHLNLGLLITSTFSALVGGSTGDALITHIPVHGEVL